MATYSISVRLRRVTVEEAYVKVPVTDAVLAPPDENGERRLAGEAVFAEAIALGADHPAWLTESREIEVHPIQKAPPELG